MDPAPFYLMLTYSICLILVSGFLVLGAERLKNKLGWESLAIAPSIIAACVGWSMGDASSQLLRTLNDASFSAHQLAINTLYTSADYCDTCWRLDLVFALCTTAISAVLIVVLQPFAKATTTAADFDENGDRTWTQYGWAWLASIWTLFVRGLTVNAMVVWAFFFSTVIYAGINPASDESSELMYQRMLLFWAGLCSLVFAGLTAKAVQLRQWLKDRQESLVDPGPGSDEPSRGVSSEQSAAGSSAEAEDGRELTCMSVTVTDEEGAAAGDSSRESRTSKIRDASAKYLAHVNRFAAFNQFIVLLESTLAFVAGGAWCNAVGVWSSQDAYPTVEVVLSDFALACGLTLFAISWLVLTEQTGSIDEDRKSKREEVEKFFVTNSLAFLVGWGWVVVLRDLTVALTGVLGDSYAAVGAATQTFLVLLFGPVLSVVLIKTKASGFSKLCCSAAAMKLIEKRGGATGDLDGGGSVQEDAKRAMQPHQEQSEATKPSNDAKEDLLRDAQTAPDDE